MKEQSQNRKGRNPKSNDLNPQKDKRIRNNNSTRPRPQSKDGKTINGIVRVSKSGNGFIDLPNGDSVIIPRNELASAISGDTVKVKLFPPRKDRPGAAGGVIEIIKRGTINISGVIETESHNFFLKPIKAKFPFVVFIAEDKLKDAKPGTAALVKITSWDDKTKASPGMANAISGEVVKTFGSRGDHETDMALLMGEALENPEFTKQLLDEVHALPDVNVEEELKNGRKDFRGIKTCTIDPERAQDFDDALSVETNTDGTYTIGVHIADVSHYVKNDNNIDIEAYRRGTSIYLVDRCIPMLPERLSNDLCSLREGVPRLTMSVTVKMRADGSILESWSGPGIILSDKRFTYGEVDVILEAKSGLLYEELNTLVSLSEKLEKTRTARGALTFNKDEIRFVLDPKGKPIDIVREKSSSSHTLVESFMLLANSITAQKIEDWHNGEGKGRGMYRVHGKPNESAIMELVMFAKQCGIRTPDTLTKSVEIIKHLMKKVTGLPIEPIMTDMIIRAQAKAHYSETNVGHFGLALKCYNHFTSPIRRYPDLVVHRIIRNLLTKGDIPYTSEELHVIAQHAGEREEKATEAERASNRYKQIEFLEKNVGDIRTGMLVGMTDMLVKIIDRETMAMVYCAPTNVRLTLGDQVEYSLDTADRLQDSLTGTVKNKVEEAK